jgi:hypothetical protein
MIVFEELAEFKNELKKLSKKFRSLENDIEIIKNVLSVKPNYRPTPSYRIDNLGIQTCIINLRK